MKSDKSKKSKKGRIVVLALLLALAVPLAGLGLFFNHYLSSTAAYCASETGSNHSGVPAVIAM